MLFYYSIINLRKLTYFVLFFLQNKSRLLYWVFSRLLSLKLINSENVVFKTIKKNHEKVMFLS